MSMFTLVISSLTTSNLPWLMNLTFQVPLQYCSLQHWTLLLSPVTSKTGCCFCFGSIPSFFLELFLLWSPVAYWAPTDLGTSSFSVLSFCLCVLFMAFSRFMGFSRSDRQRAWWTMDGGLWHCMGDKDQDHPHGKEMQKGIKALVACGVQTKELSLLWVPSGSP